ncbi:MAG: MBL fold metallo-hydrolase [Alphaproteobacteria bacterium]|nr:MBL fold metallo-hydrolase [Alphaproteobacteria bacterium]MCZ6813852.1 MBL fold metallo-hydrolase [Alphaproteobacteria bacterium]
MRDIVSDILTWSWFSEPHGYNFNGHLIRDPGGNICVDPVEPTSDDLDAIVQQGVTRIVLTNRNHSRAANRVRARTGARTVIHADDAEHARSQDTELDGELTIGDRIGPLEVVGAAGKSPGEVALFWRDRGILIVGDAIIGNPPGRCGLLPERVMDDPARLRANVRKLLDLDFDILLVGDGASLLDDAKARLKELVETFPN